MAKFYDSSIYLPAGTLVGNEIFTIFQSGQTRTTTFSQLMTDLVQPSIDSNVINSIGDITDVTITTPLDGHILKYQSGSWVNIADGVVTNLNDLIDVTITTPLDGHILKYQSGLWVNIADSPSNPFDQNLNTTDSPSFAGIYYLNRSLSSVDNMMIGSTNSTVTGGNNIFIGYETGILTNSGNQNTFIGIPSAPNNTTGSKNVYVGNYTGNNNTTGYENTFLGYQAGNNNNDAYGNVFVGYRSGAVTIDGIYNTFVGHNSGTANASGTDNVSLGYNAGANLTTGSFNILLGSGAQTSSVSATYQCVIGNTTTPTFVGIGGNNDPQYELDVLGSINYTGSVYKNGTELASIVASDTPPVDTSIYWIDTSV